LTKEEELVRIGEIVNTHGIHGRLHVRYHNEDTRGFLAYKRLLLKHPRGRLEVLEVTEARIHRKSIIVQLRGVNTLDQAEHLVGKPLFVERASLPELEEGEYYWTDLIGMDVVTTETEVVGQIVRIVRTGANDVLVVGQGRKELLIPATEEVVKEVDLVSRRLVIQVLEGLI